jgi:phosphoenolpyruvate-protein kinase (PTS system EI component)
MGSISRSTLCLVKKFLISILMVTALSVYASESPKPVEVEADGEAYMSEIDTPKEVIERAKREAEKKAIEKAIGVFIRSHTLVSNSQLAEDLVYATVRGRIQKSEVIKEGWDEKDRNLYKVKLKALVEPLYPERGEGLSLKLSLSKSELKEADEGKDILSSR